MASAAVGRAETLKNDSLTKTVVFAVRLSSAVTSPSVCSLHILFEQSRAAKNTQLKPESALFVLFQQSISTRAGYRH